MTAKQIRPRPIRFPEQMEKEIEKLAKKEHRSFHGQVLHMLQGALDTHRGFLDKKSNQPNPTGGF